MTLTYSSCIFFQCSHYSTRTMFCPRVPKKKGMLINFYIVEVLLLIRVQSNHFFVDKLATRLIECHTHHHYSRTKLSSNSHFTSEKVSYSVLRLSCKSVTWSIMNTLTHKQYDNLDCLLLSKIILGIQENVLDCIWVRNSSYFMLCLGPSEPVDMNGELAQLVKKMISDDKVVIFSKTYCPYCTMAKEVRKILYLNEIGLFWGITYSSIFWFDRSLTKSSLSTLLWSWTNVMMGTWFRQSWEKWQVLLL